MHARLRFIILCTAALLALLSLSACNFELPPLPGLNAGAEVDDPADEPEPLEEPTPLPAITRTPRPTFTPTSDFESETPEEEVTPEPVEEAAGGSDGDLLYGVKFLGVSWLKNDLLVSFKFPGTVGDPYAYRLTLNEHEFTCQKLGDYPNRLYCHGSGAGIKGAARAKFYYNGSGSPGYEQLISVPPKGD
jgi:hypothetical protein